MEDVVFTSINSLRSLTFTCISASALACPFTVRSFRFISCLRSLDQDQPSWKGLEAGEIKAGVGLVASSLPLVSALKHLNEKYRPDF
jgi:hypothetical protein